MFNWGTRQAGSSQSCAMILLVQVGAPELWSLAMTKQSGGGEGDLGTARAAGAVLLKMLGLEALGTSDPRLMR